MDSIHTALELLTEDCWMASIDLKDAYYGFKVHNEFQKYLKFCYKDRLYKYIAFRMVSAIVLENLPNF